MISPLATLGHLFTLVYLVFLFSVQNAHNMQNDDGKKLFNVKTESASYQFQIPNIPVVSILWDEQTQTMQQGIPTVCMHIKGKCTNICHL